MVASNDLKAYLPTTKKELQLRGWDEVDVIIFSGDAYIDHPAFGAAVIGRVLEHAGYKVAIVPQPDWRGDHRDFTKLGKPRLFFAITAGSMDSMVNHYTAAKRLRSDDAYTPDGKAGMRPDYCTITYSNILRQLYPDIPIVIGGVEASMRRLTHYDYWSDKLMPSILVDSKADILVYGMGEKQVLAIARCLEDASKRLQDGSNAAYSLEAKYVSKEELLKEADFVSLNLPYTPEVRHLIGAAELEMMKSSAYLINTARGAHVDEEALVEALKAGEIAGAAMDVYEHEPKIHPELLKLDNVVLSPHTGTGTWEGRIAMCENVCDNILAFVNNEIDKMNIVL